MIRHGTVRCEGRGCLFMRLGKNNETSDKVRVLISYRKVSSHLFANSLGINRKVIGFTGLKQNVLKGLKRLSYMICKAFFVRPSVPGGPAGPSRKTISMMF